MALSSLRINLLPLLLLLLFLPSILHAPKWCRAFIKEIFATISVAPVHRWLQFSLSKHSIIFAYFVLCFADLVMKFESNRNSEALKDKVKAH